MTLPGAPTPATYLRAALPAVPGIGSLPGVRRTGDTLPTTARQADGVAVDTEHLARYSAVCGFGLRADLPLTYPHVLAFGLQMQLLTGADFPFPAVGLVHVANRFEAARTVRSRRSRVDSGRAASNRLATCTRPTAGNGKSAPVRSCICSPNASTCGYVSGRSARSPKPQTAAYRATCSVSTVTPRASNVAAGSVSPLRRTPGRDPIPGTAGSAARR